jgi:hypothetical protein
MWRKLGWRFGAPMEQPSPQEADILKMKSSASPMENLKIQPLE